MLVASGLAMVAAGCGGSGSSSSQPAPTALPAATTTLAATTATLTLGGGGVPTGPPTRKYVASLTADGHTVGVGRPWTFTVRTHEKNGRPVAGTVVAQVLSGSNVIDTIGWFGYNGSLRKTFRFREAERGQELTFRATILANGGTRKLDYPVTVK